ncbi:LysR family transcriptional regulator [Paraburkholderia hospita]|uniref:LysR family transcriptional regulator n=2 Tax=Paraburkholderia hospita TaxID=169430 RepID=A0ABN0FCP4_9BURK|nr:LysR family transcriptional regulator [Paraburkholderia hospita]
MAPPSLTRAVQEAERLLQFRVFYRTKRTVSLTAAGAAYVPEARAAMLTLSHAQELGERAAGGELGRVRVGYVASAAFAGVMQRTVVEFRRRHPHVEVELSEAPMEEIPRMLVDDRLDIAYVRPPVSFPDEIVSTCVYKDEFVVAIPDGSPLTNHPVLSPRQLHDACFALPEQDSGTFEVARRGRFQPMIGPRPGTLAAVLACVALGGSVAVVPRALCNCVTLPGVVYRPLSGKPIVSEIAVATRKFEHSQAVNEFRMQAIQKMRT